AESPREWTKLAPQIPLPMNELTAGRVAKQDYSPGSPQLQFGLLAGLRVALWVPVLRSGALFGILFAGSRTPRASLPQSELEAVAAELSLVLELEHERTNSLRRQADLKFCKESFAALAERPALRRWLARIVESCTEVQRQAHWEPSLPASSGLPVRCVLCGWNFIGNLATRNGLLRSSRSRFRGFASMLSRRARLREWTGVLRESERRLRESSSFHLLRRETNSAHS